MIREVNELGAAAPDQVGSAAGAVRAVSSALRLRPEIPVASASLFSLGVAWAALDFMTGAGITAAIAWQTARTAIAAGIRACPLAIDVAFAVLFACFSVTLSHFFGLYAPGVPRVNLNSFVRLVLSISIAVLAMWGVQSTSGIYVMANVALLLAGLMGAGVMLGARVLWHWHRLNVSNKETHARSFLIVGKGQIGCGIRDYLVGLPFGGYAFKGFVSMSEYDAGDEVVGKVEDAMLLARSMFVDEVIFSSRLAVPGLLSTLIGQAKDMGIDVRIIPTLTETLANRADVQYIGDLPTIAVLQRRHHMLSRVAKRSIDVVGASAAMLLLAPVFAAIAIAIKLQSPGAVFYASKRVGYKGRVFTCFKFRTMVVNAPAMQASLAHLNERSGVLFKIAKDPRITRVGAVLRKYSLDELPQLWNVLRGDMSLVGPRPSISSEVAQYEPAHLRRLDVVPGITGLWQVEARRDSSFESYIQLDSEYIKQWSLWLDAKILLRTINAVVTGTGS